ncbi:hypothetical protein [Salinicoccus albus]|uniref:hypothetical protein n=1 Tax=Salinicoccus albus TaxID=418756 RepID=UPI00036E8CB6|nr:hypothetical protein [Salinicoccus albus]
MKQSIEIVISTFFVLIAILYLSDRYTAFDMAPPILVIGCLILIIFTVLCLLRNVIRQNLFSVSIVVLTLFILLTLLI